MIAVIDRLPMPQDNGGCRKALVALHAGCMANPATWPHSPGNWSVKRARARDARRSSVNGAQERQEPTITTTTFCCRALSYFVVVLSTGNTHRSWAGQLLAARRVARGESMPWTPSLLAGHTTNDGGKTRNLLYPVPSRPRGETFRDALAGFGLAGADDRSTGRFLEGDDSFELSCSNTRVFFFLLTCT